MTSTRQTSLSASGLAVIAAPIFLLLTGCGQPPEPPEAIRPVKTMLLDPSASTVRRAYPGKVGASQKAVMAFQVSGPLIELPVTEGQEVEKDQVLAQIDPRDFKTNLADAAAAVVRP